MTYGYEEFKSVIYKMTEIDLNLYKERQMKRRIDTLIARKGYSGYYEFIKGMEQDDDLLRAFVCYLTINVSQFYRNPAQWETLEHEIISDIIRNGGKKIRIWSAACSTGDEPYTLAMMFLKYLPAERLEIIATDLDENVMEFAKEGVYPEKSLVDLPKEYLDQYFKEVSSGYFAISNDIKKLVTFRKHNLLKDEYFKDIDFIVCRNVVIYFTEEAKVDVYKKFFKSLTKKGVLFIGSTEQILKPKEIGFASYKTFFYKKDE